LRHIHPLPAVAGAFLTGDCLFLRLAILTAAKKSKSMAYGKGNDGLAAVGWGSVARRYSFRALW
jgi:hypothetical protein